MYKVPRKNGGGSPFSITTFPVSTGGPRMPGGAGGEMLASVKSTAIAFEPGSIVRMVAPLVLAVPGWYVGEARAPATM
ncbi:hypothetical protein D3C83_74320 [compost metagenome]